MFGLVGKLTATPGDGATLASILVEGTREMPGCHSYLVATDRDDPDAVWVTEVWESEEAHAASLKLPQVQAAIGKGRPLIAGMERIATTRPVPEPSRTGTVEMVEKVAFVVYPAVEAERARSFYEGVLGLALGSHGQHGDSFWIEYDLPGGGCLALSNATTRKPGASEGGTVALEVADLDAMIARLTEASVPILADIIHGPRCRMVPCLDPDGNSLILHQLNDK